jgi:hypothetical protein
MITLQQLKARMEETPFRAFRLHTTDGKTYDVPNHDAMFLKRNCVEIALDPDSDGAALKFVHVAYLHITTMEDLSPAEAT